MTGFARTAGYVEPFRWSWELRTVNAKGLDLRLRLPPGLDALEIEARAILSRRLARGTCYAGLSVERDATRPTVTLNRDVLAGLISALQALPDLDPIRPASLDGLLGVPGVVEVSGGEMSKADFADAAGAVLTGLADAVEALLIMRRVEGRALTRIMDERLANIERLTGLAEDLPGRTLQAVRARLERSVAQLIETGAELDPNRLHQEAVMLAARADVREELDRLNSHVGAARGVLAAGGPVGRRLDFLAQEFAREANTLCAKANDIALTNIGLDLKTEIEQFREQIQNLE
jgi:uncharacterized protein (TIGR00255 family)